MIPIDPYPPLAGVRVLEAARVLAGPYCGQLLGDLGAEVVKAERPGSGDDTRAWGPPFQGELSAYFLSCNRNKKSITLDFANDQGMELLHRLLDRADVLLENFRTDSAEKWKLTGEELLKRHPNLIICSFSGYGRTGTWREVPGYDFAAQGLSGLMAITGPCNGPPSKVGVAITDVLTGVYAAVAVLACLHARKASGHGYAIDLSLLDCAVASQVNVAQAYLTGGTVPPRQGNAHLQIVPYQLFATADGWIVLTVGNDSQWQAFCRAAEAPDLAGDERFGTNPDRVRHRDVLIPQIEGLMRSRSNEEWKRRLGDAKVPHAEVWNYAQLFASEPAQDRGLRVSVRDPEGNPVDLIGSPFRIAGAGEMPMTCPPKLGADTETVLRDWLGERPGS